MTLHAKHRLRTVFDQLAMNTTRHGKYKAIKHLKVKIALALFRFCNKLEIRCVSGISCPEAIVQETNVIIIIFFLM